MRRRVTLIEEPPAIWIQDGLIYVSFGIQDGSIIAFRPSAWFATSAIGRQVTEEWHDSAAPAIAIKYKDTG